jgi:hypothetical protein
MRARRTRAAAFVLGTAGDSYNRPETLFGRGKKNLSNFLKKSAVRTMIIHPQ